jgi:hypothetical protein
VWMVTMDRLWVLSAIFKISIISWRAFSLVAEISFWRESPICQVTEKLYHIRLCPVYLVSSGIQTLAIMSTNCIGRQCHSNQYYCWSSCNTKYLLNLTSCSWYWIYLNINQAGLKGFVLLCYWVHRVILSTPNHK